MANSSGTGAVNSSLSAANSPFMTGAGNSAAAGADYLGFQAADSADQKAFSMASYQISKDLKYFQIAMAAMKQALQGMQ